MASMQQQREQLSFTHERIDSNPPSQRLVFCEPVDITGNGLPDIVIGGKGAPANFSMFGIGTRFPNYKRKLRDFVGQREVNLFWYENTGSGWVRHNLAETGQLEVGAELADIDGDGRTDLLAGRTINYDEVYWFQQPEAASDTWTKRVLTEDFDMYHDLLYGDIDDDGEPEVIGLSQADESVFYYDIPPDPTVEPWPSEYQTIVDSNLSAEGVALADIDGDGRTELLAGTNVFHRTDAEGATWMRDPILKGWDSVRVAVADLDGDGDLEIVYAEGDSPAHGTHPARVAVVDPADGYEAEILRDDMYCPHSLQIGDFTGDGRPDIYVGEMGLGENPSPEHVIFVNQPDGEFREKVIWEGIPTHEAKALDMTGTGTLDIVGKSFKPNPTVDVWYNDRTYGNN